jgi:hypothetical protein
MLGSGTGLADSPGDSDPFLKVVGGEVPVGAWPWVAFDVPAGGWVPALGASVAAGAQHPLLGAKVVSALGPHDQHGLPPTHAPHGLE